MANSFGGGAILMPLHLSNMAFHLPSLATLILSLALRRQHPWTLETIHEFVFGRSMSTPQFAQPLFHSLARLALSSYSALRSELLACLFPHTGWSGWLTQLLNLFLALELS